MARPIARRCPCRSLNRREPSQVREYLSWFINRSRDQARYSSAIGAPSRRSQCQARWAITHSLCTPRLFEIATAICREVPSTSSSTSAETAADGAGPKKLDRLSDGVIAAGGAGGGAIDPGSERSSSTASSSSSHPGCHAGMVNGRREVCGRSGTARADGSEVLPSDNIPPPPSGEQYLLTGDVCGQNSDHNSKKRICNVRTRSLWYVEIVVCRLYHTSSFRETSF